MKMEKLEKFDGSLTLTRSWCWQFIIQYNRGYCFSQRENFFEMLKHSEDVEK